MNAPEQFNAFFIETNLIFGAELLLMNVRENRVGGRLRSGSQAQRLLLELLVQLSIRSFQGTILFNLRRTGDVENIVKLSRFGPISYRWRSHLQLQQAYNNANY